MRAKTGREVDRLLALESQPLAFHNPGAPVHSQNTQPGLGPHIPHVIENRNGERDVFISYLPAWGLSQTVLTAGAVFLCQSQDNFPGTKASVKTADCRGDVSPKVEEKNWFEGIHQQLKTLTNSALFKKFTRNLNRFSFTFLCLLSEHVNYT